MIILIVVSEVVASVNWNYYYFTGNTAIFIASDI